MVGQVEGKNMGKAHLCRAVRGTVGDEMNAWSKEARFFVFNMLYDVLRDVDNHDFSKMTRMAAFEM